LGFVGAPAASAKTATITTYQFPSSSSTVVGSVGFINSTECGYFWSVSRGDSVTQTFTGGPATISKARLRGTVVTANLVNGAHVDWELSINGVVIARFRIQQGFTGTFTVMKAFGTITGPDYTVKIRVINEVPVGDGSITLAYAGTSPHVVQLVSP
jgi:hypothetical protein